MKFHLSTTKKRFDEINVGQLGTFLTLPVEVVVDGDKKIVNFISRGETWD